MKRTTLMTGLAAVALLSLGLGANAGSWPNLPAKAKAAPAKQAVVEKEAATLASTADGFEYTGGESIWSLKVAKYEFVAGRLAHSSDCIFASADTAKRLPAATGRAMDYSLGG